MGETDKDSQELAMNIHWTVTLEEYFARTGEKANCLSWVHKRSEQIFNRQKTYIDLPVAIGSAVTGFISVGSTTMFAGQQQISSIAIGAASLAVSILNTIGSYFGWAKRAEGHRISAIHYAKLYRYISVEMSLPRDERMAPGALLKYVKDQYDRLAEISPLVPDSVIGEFKSKFEKYTDVSKPEEANGLNKIDIFVPNPNDDAPILPLTPMLGKADRRPSQLLLPTTAAKSSS